MKPQLSCLQLEDRLTPALSVMALSGGGLLITGTPEATSPGFSEGFNEQVTVTRIYASTYEVKDGGKPVGDGDHGVPGEYNIFGDLKLKFDGINNDVVVDLDGGPLTGNLSIDLGKGDTDTNTPNYVTVVDGTVRGKVSFAGAQGNESIAVGIPLHNEVEDHYGDKEYNQGLAGQSPVTVEQGVTVSGRVKTDAPNSTLRNEFSLGEESVVNGNLSTRGVNFTTIDGMVKGHAKVQTSNLKTNSTLDVNGQVDKDVTIDSAQLFTAKIAGTVKGDVNVRATGDYTFLGVTGQVGDDVRVESSKAAKADIGGTVKGDATVRATEAELLVAQTGTVGDDARVFTTGDSDDPSIYLATLNVAGRVGDDVQVESSGRAKATIAQTGTVMGDVAVQASNAYAASRDVSANLNVNGLVGGTVRVNWQGSGPVETSIAGTVKGDVAMKGKSDTGATLKVTKTGLVGEDVILNESEVEGGIDLMNDGTVLGTVKVIR